MAPPVVIVGAGLAGLSCAIHLAAAGREVTVLEARDAPGGCCGTVDAGGYRFDAGPSVLTMPEVLRATVGAAGEELADWLPLDRLDPGYRIGFHDGSHLDVRADPAAMTAEVERLAGAGEARRYERFRARLDRLFEAEWQAFIDRNYEGPLDLVQPLALARLARLGGFRRLDRLVAAELRDWRLRRAHTFQALYVGLSPFAALGIYAVVARMDTVGGVFVPRRGGMHAVPVALARVAAKAGAELRYGERVAALEPGPDGVRAVRTESGNRLPAAAVVVTGDLPEAHRRLLPEAARDWRLTRRRPRFAPSCYLLQLGLTRQLPRQAHHTLHLGADWRGTFSALTAEYRVQPDPSLLVTYPVAADPDAAPRGHATLTVLEPVPNLLGGQRWAELGPRLRARLLARLAGLGYGDLAAGAAVERVTDPLGWAAQGYSVGTPFGLDHRFSQTGWLRPANAARRVPGLFFAGKDTVPGIGVPMVLVSGRLAAERVLAAVP